MALYGKKTNVNTPFDDYSKRRDAARIKRGTGKSEVYMSDRSAVFLAALILSFSMKCDTVLQILWWIAVVMIPTAAWLLAGRFIMPKKKMIYALWANVLSVALYGAAYTVIVPYLEERSAFVARIAGRNIMTVQDCFYLIPLSVGLAVLGSGGINKRENEESPAALSVGREVLMPFAVAAAVSIVSSAVCMLTGITRGFFVILFSALLLGAVSLTVTNIRGCGWYFTSIERTRCPEIPVNKKADIRKFTGAKLKLFIACVAAVIASTAVEYAASAYSNFSAEPFSLALVSLFLGIFMLVPMRKQNRQDFGQRCIVFEYPFLTALLSLPVSGFLPGDILIAEAITMSGITAIAVKTVLYLIAVIAADAVISGLISSVSRRMIFADRPRFMDGIPLILVASSVIIMVGTVFFMVY